ncbi:MAG: hypothetical protein PHQ80_04075 [Candidatus ainarchaeum sp.]|nr:hypothetical protein [Candidatus ainarchaeum sp.]MDD5096851.1 hypothetical protein [Candidatus ainarchaeum sp.]
MCRLCDAAENSSYAQRMDASVNGDMGLLEKTRGKVEKFPSVGRSLLTTIDFPPVLHAPLFEARNAYTLINNYFQQLMLDGNRMGAMFSGGSTRSIFFSDDYLVLFSKSVAQDAGSTFFGHYLLFHFTKDEYGVKWDGANLSISVDCRKKAKNLLSGEAEEHAISFNFLHQNVEGRILKKEEAMRSDYVRKIYGARGEMGNIFASADLEGYVVTVPHFSPHPYLLQAGAELGHPTNRHFQEHVIDYLLEHLNLQKD